MKLGNAVLGTELFFAASGQELAVGDIPRSEAPASLDADADAQSRFIQQHLRRIFLLIYRIVGNAEDAQDLTQDTFIKALQRQDQLKDLDKSAHWLSRIAANTAIDFLRRNKKYSFGDLSRVSDTASSLHENVEQSLLRGERWRHLDGGLATLTERERTALVLRDLEDMPADEVAAQMNCSMATVRSHIANARAKFKRYLEGRKSF